MAKLAKDFSAYHRLETDPRYEAIKNLRKELQTLQKKLKHLLRNYVITDGVMAPEEKHHEWQGTLNRIATIEKALVDSWDSDWEPPA